MPWPVSPTSRRPTTWPPGRCGATGRSSSTACTACTHHHVYGANLGVRADAYLRVGGFPADGSGEDHGLWQRLAAAGYTLVQPVGIRVRTSARLRGRADGGLAGLLRALHLDDHQAGHRAGDAICDGA